MSAYGSARSAYGRMSNGKAAGRALLEDRKLQRELSDAVTSLRDVTSSLREPPRRRAASAGMARMLTVLAIGGTYSPWSSARVCAPRCST